MAPTDSQADRLSQSLRPHESELTGLMEDGPPGLQWVNAAGIILRANRVDREILGYGADDIAGRHIAEFHVDPYAINDILRHFADKEPLVDFEARLRHKDGSIRYILISATPVFDGEKFLHMRCYARDVTGARQMEEELRRVKGEQEHVYRLMVEREHRMIELKRQVNRLSEMLGQPAPYNLAFADQPTA